MTGRYFELWSGESEKQAYHRILTIVFHLLYSFLKKLALPHLKGEEAKNI